MREFQEFSRIRQVRQAWESLVFPDSQKLYQRYAFQEICCRYRKTSLSNIKKGNTTCSFIVEYENARPVCIAPLAVERCPRQIHLLGHGTNAGYLDFIYGQDTCKEQVQEMLDYCKRRYEGYEMDFLFVPQSSLLGELLKVTQTFENYAIALSSYEAYVQSLSKSTRQNIRTAYNRMKKDGRKGVLTCYRKGDLGLEEAIWRANQVYQKRRKQWGVGIGPQKAVNARICKRDVVYQALRKMEEAVLAMFEVDGNLASFFVGYEVPGRIYIPRLAIDTELGRYSPGILLILEYLKEKTTSGEAFVFDLGRGDETYKKILGGGLNISIRGTY